MWYSNIFCSLIIIISKHYAAGGMLDKPVKIAQEAYTDGREEIQNKATEAQNDLKGILCSDDEPFRSIDGTCNNLKKPSLGAAGTAYGRAFGNSYSDGKEELPSFEEGDSLKSARLLSLKLYDNKKKQGDHSLLTMVFGQLVYHDIALAIIGDTVICCDKGEYTSNQKTHPKCDAIAVPDCDKVYGSAGLECRPFTRVDKNGCKPANPISGATHWIDASFVYGSDVETASSLRKFEGGELRTAKRHGKEWLPQNMNPMAECYNLSSSHEPCYQAGDVRVNQHTLLTVLQIILHRFHNYIARRLCGHEKCPWDDTRCYQEARRIVIAIWQNIVYTVYLPILLGREYMIKHKLLYKEDDRDEDGYVDDYSCESDPSMLVETAIAMRGQHSAIPDFYKLYYEDEENYKNKKCYDDDYFYEKGAIELAAWMNKPSVIEKGNNAEGLSRCFFGQRQEKIDTNFVDGIRHNLYRFGKPYGEDLTSLDIERGRDYGTDWYCEILKKLRILSKCDCFDDLKKVIPKKSIAILKKMYNGQVDKVELMTGGMMERLVRDTLVGRTFQAIIGKQFLNLRRADRYFYERKDQPYPLTPDQLSSIRKVDFGHILCVVGDDIQRVPKDTFWKLSKENPLVDCCDLEPIDFSPFQNYDDNC